MKIIKMIILMRPICHALVRADFALAGGEAHDGGFARLIVATAVVVVLVVVVVRAFAVVVVVACAALILGIRTALSERMLGVRSMQMAGLLGGTFGRRSLAVASTILVVRLALVAVGGVIARLVIARSFLHVLLLIPCSSREIRGMSWPDMPEVPRLKGLLPHDCVRCSCVVAIDAAMTIVVGTG